MQSQRKPPVKSASQAANLRSKRFERRPMSWRPKRFNDMHIYNQNHEKKHLKSECVNMLEMAPSLCKSTWIQSLQLPFPSNASTFSSPTPLESRTTFHDSRWHEPSKTPGPPIKKTFRKLHRPRFTWFPCSFCIFHWAVASTPWPKELCFTANFAGIHWAQSSSSTETRTCSQGKGASSAGVWPKNV